MITFIVFALACGIVAVWHLTAAIRHRLRTRTIIIKAAEANEEWLRARLPGMSVPDLDMPHGMWPTCSTPPCDWEDNHVCTRHQYPHGKHHADPVTEVISVDEWAEEMERRFAQ